MAESGGAARVGVSVIGTGALAGSGGHDGDAILPATVRLVGAATASSKRGGMAAVGGGGVVNFHATDGTPSAKEIQQGPLAEMPRPGEALEAPPPIAVADPPVTAWDKSARRGLRTGRPSSGARALGKRPARQHGRGDGQSRGGVAHAGTQFREGSGIERRVPKNGRAGSLVGGVVAKPNRKRGVTGARLSTMGWTLDGREARAAAVKAPGLPSEGPMPRAGEAERGRPDAALGAAVDD